MTCGHTTVKVYMDSVVVSGLQILNESPELIY